MHLIGTAHRPAAELTELLRKTVSEGELEIDVDPTFNLGSITVELDSLSVDEPLAFADVIYKADNFEIYPLTNGKIRLDVTFQSVLKTIKLGEKKMENKVIRCQDCYNKFIFTVKQQEMCAEKDGRILLDVRAVEQGKKKFGQQQGTTRK